MSNAVEGLLKVLDLETLEVNLFGVIHGLQCFVPAMLEQNTPGIVVNTGSKQGITNPPGDPAYNVGKAAIKALTEHLQHNFRTTEGCRLSAHLLVPGFTYTGFIRKWLPEKPDGAWLPEQVIEYMAESLQRGDFFLHGLGHAVRCGDDVVLLFDLDIGMGDVAVAFVLLDEDAPCGDGLYHVGG